MNLKEYEKPLMQIKLFKKADVITASQVEIEGEGDTGDDIIIPGFQ